MNRDIEELGSAAVLFRDDVVGRESGGAYSRERKWKEGPRAWSRRRLGHVGFADAIGLGSASATAIAKGSDIPASLAAGAAQAVERNQDPFGDLKGGFDVTLNFAAWDDKSKLLSSLRQRALGHATAVHPLMHNFDEGGWLGGTLRTIRQKREMRKRLPRGTRNYAWVLFRPDQEALSEMARLVEAGRLSLSIGIRAPLREPQGAFEHVRRRAAGRALLIP